MNRITINTHLAMWKFEKKIYHIDRIKLPVPVVPSQLVYVGLALLAMAAIPIKLPFAIKYILVPCGAAIGLKKIKLEGKNPLRYAIAFIAYTLAPKTYGRLRPIRKINRANFSCINYRKSELIDATRFARETGKNSRR